MGKPILVRRLAMADPNHSQKGSPMGEIIDDISEVEVTVSKRSDEPRAGLKWELSAEAIQANREIDENIRAAEQLGGLLLLR
jgi:hypothetical protein